MAEVLADLRQPDPKRRELAAAELGDRLDSSRCAPDEAERAVAALVGLVVAEPDPVVREEALHAIGEAFNRRTYPLRLFDALREHLPAMTPADLDWALYILASTHDPAARPAIEAFLHHPDPAVRGYATEALTELPGRTEA